MKYLDLHAHVLKYTYKDNYEKVIDDIANYDGAKIVNIALDYETSVEAINLAKKYPHIYKVAIGVHPTSDLSTIDSDIPKFKKLYLENKEFIIAIGETGFNKFEEDDIEYQRHAFMKQIELAQELNLPLIIHSRNADEEVYNVFKDIKNLPTTILHSWTGGIEWTKKLLNLGLYISYTGIITFKNAQDVRENMYITPLDKVFYETDCPWLSPVPYRGKTNIPEYSIYVAKTIATHHNIEIEELNKKVSDNFEKVFKNSKWLYESK